MYPIRSVEVTCIDPVEAEFWVPSAVELREEGMGLFFQDIAPIPRLAMRDLRELIKFESDALDFASSEAVDEAEFESLAQNLEQLPEIEEDLYEIPDRLLESGVGLYGLDLGVSALSYSLAAQGFYPVASCRSHLYRSWSECPVVIFACERKRLERLLPLCRTCECGLDEVLDRGRPLFSVYAESVVNLNRLATEVASFKAFASREGTSGRSASGRPAIKPAKLEHPKLF